MSASYRPMCIVLAATMLMATVAVVPDGVKADDSSIFWTWKPSAENSTFVHTIPFPITSPVPAQEVQVRGDSQTYDLQYSGSDAACYLETNDFTGSIWYNEYESDYIVGTPPPDNATIIAVLIVAHFMTASPDLALWYSVSGGGSDPAEWNYSDVISAGYGPQMWNVTELEEWTPQMLNSTDFWCRVSCSTDNGVHYYLDYLGYIAMYSVPYLGGYVPGEDDPPEEGSEGAQVGYDFIFQDGGVVAIMGLVGFVGLMVIPAGAIYLYRADPGQGKINLFIKLLVMWMFCLTLVLVNFGGS